MKNMIGILMGLVIGVILIGSLLAPTIEGIQKTAGEDKTLDNSVVGTYTYNEWKGEDVSFSLTRNPTLYKMNDTEISLALPQQILIASNFFSLRTGGTSGNYDINLQYVGLTAGNGKTFTFEVVNGEYTLTISPGNSDESVMTGKLEWMFYAVPSDATGNSGLGQIASGSISNFYTSDVNDIVVLGNIYTTGENDTYYAYYDGKLTVNEEYESVSSVNISKTVKDGYTNIYDTSVTVNIGEESFTPYFILAPLTVNGNEASGAAYSLYGAVIILALAAVLILGVRIITNRD